AERHWRRARIGPASPPTGHPRSRRRPDLRLIVHSRRQIARRGGRVALIRRSGRPPGAAPLPGRAAEPQGRSREKVMDSITRDNWERFYDRVVVRGRNWPRRLWFAAVEDGLRAGLSAQSPLLAQYRQDV